MCENLKYTLLDVKPFKYAKGVVDKCIINNVNNVNNDNLLIIITKRWKYFKSTLKNAD